MKDANMLDILAVLDAAIDEIAPPVTSRSSRQRADCETPTGSPNPLSCPTVHALPVLPVEKRGVHQDPQRSRKRITAKEISSERRSRVYPFFYEKYGKHGEFREFPRVSAYPWRQNPTGSHGNYGKW
jgi:hypothetical protein